MRVLSPRFPYGNGVAEVADILPSGLADDPTGAGDKGTSTTRKFLGQLTRGDLSGVIGQKNVLGSSHRGLRGNDVRYVRKSSAVEDHERSQSLRLTRADPGVAGISSGCRGVL
jgi:hypothetical protein